MKIYTIYKATNLINNKVYIGFDSSWPKRKYRHISDSNNSESISYNDLFHKALRKYGHENFSWEVIYNSKDGNHCKNIMENHFIEVYTSYCNLKNTQGYNMTFGGDGVLGLKKSEKTKKIHSIKSAKIYKFWYNGELIEVKNLKKYCQNNNLNYSNMQRLFYQKSNRFKHQNYYIYDGETNFNDVLLKYSEKIKKSMQIMGEKHSKNWKLVSPQNEIFEFNNLTSFCKENNLCHRKMRQTLIGNCIYYPGWRKIN